MRTTLGDCARLVPSWPVGDVTSMRARQRRADPAAAAQRSRCRCPDARQPARPRALQGHHQGPDAVRRPPSGHRAQPQGRGLDRSAAQELRLPDRAPEVRIQPAHRRSQGCAVVARGGDQTPAEPGDRQRRSARRPGRLALSRHHAADRRQQRSQCAARREAARAESRTDDQRPARGGVLHQGRRPRGPTRCTSSAPTWTATAGAKRPTTTARARRW